MQRNEAMRATVVGAGVVGLTTAVTLAERGAQVTLVEHSRELGGNASWLAGGMLAPFCEGESAPQNVVELGQGAIEWWGARVPGVVRKGTLVVAPPRDLSEIERFAARTKAHMPADEARIAELEPDLAGRFRKGLFFPGEGHLDPRVALSALTERLRARGYVVRINVRTPERSICRAHTSTQRRGKNKKALDSSSRAFFCGSSEPSESGGWYRD